MLAKPGEGNFQTQLLRTPATSPKFRYVEKSGGTLKKRFDGHTSTFRNEDLKEKHLALIFGSSKMRGRIPKFYGK